MNRTPEGREKIFRRLYSVKEASEILGCSSWTVAELTRSGDLPYVPRGRRKFIDIFDLDKWIDNQKVRETIL